MSKDNEALHRMVSRSTPTLRFVRFAVAVAVLAALMSAISLTRPERALAADNGQWSVFPTTAPGPSPVVRGYFQPLMTPGVALQDHVTITNKTDEPLSFNIFTADAFNTAEGGFALRHKDEPRLDMGAWMSVPETNITIKAHSGRVLPVFINPPVDATPGDHTGGIVVEATVPKLSQRGALTVRSIEAVGDRVYGRVVGPLDPRLSITKFRVSTHGGLGSLLGAPVTTDISYEIKNTGNQRITPTALLRLSPLVGPGKHLKARNIPELLPHGSALVHQTLTSPIPILRLSAHLRVFSTAPAVSTSATSNAWVFPWVLIAVVAAIVVIVVWYRRRGAEPTIDPGAPDSVAGGDSGQAAPTLEETIKA